MTYFAQDMKLVCITMEYLERMFIVKEMALVDVRDGVIWSIFHFQDPRLIMYIVQGIMLVNQQPLIWGKRHSARERYHVEVLLSLEALLLIVMEMKPVQVTLSMVRCI